LIISFAAALFGRGVGEHLLGIGEPFGDLVVYLGINVHGHDVFVEAGHAVHGGHGISRHVLLIEFGEGVLPDGVNKGVLVVEIAVHRHGGEVGLLGDAVYGGGVDPVADEKVLGGLDDPGNIIFAFFTLFHTVISSPRIFIAFIGQVSAQAPAADAAFLRRSSWAASRRLCSARGKRSGSRRSLRKGRVRNICRSYQAPPDAGASAVYVSFINLIYIQKKQIVNTKNMPPGGLITSDGGLFSW
jgi:hypothetical protein